MVGLVLAALGLGIAGIDPAGALIAISALAAGARDRHVVGFAVVALLGTAVLGTVLSLTVGQELGVVQWSRLLPPDRLAALVELLIAVGLLWWGVVRLRRPGARPPKPASSSRTGAAALVGLGAVFAGSAVLDPTFVGLVVLAGREGAPLATAVAHLLWAVVSQVMLVVLAAAILTRHHGPVVTRFQRLLARVRPAMATAATSALLVAAAVLAVDDATWWFLTGRFLLPDAT